MNALHPALEAFTPGRSRPIAATADMPPVLLVPGLGDSGPEHWQTLWAAQHRDFRRVVQADWHAPRLDIWAAAVARAIDVLRHPPLIVAHSFGCLAAVRAGHLFERPIAAALLVAPADPDHFYVGTKLPTRRLPYPSTLVASSNDPWMKILKAGALATRWGSRFVALESAGHINVDSGHGEWPEGLRLLRALRHQAAQMSAARSSALSADS